MGRRRDQTHMTSGTRAGLLAGTALCAAALTLPAAAQPAPNARPTGGVVSAGAAAISRSPSNTQIDQSTQRAAIDWQSFNVGSQQGVTFKQPSSSAVTLNRVVGPDPSQIAGRIDANGQVVLVNQSGVTFYKGAQVNTNGLMVSAAGISNQNFMAGNMKFDQPGNPDAKIVNQGTITVRQAGLAALVAPQVANSGVINAKLGHVVLAGARTATLDLYGDGLVSLDVSNQVTATPAGATALVTNTGVIAADGGTVQLTAAAADGVVQKLVDAGGKIHAATVANHMGTIALNGVGGDIVVEGQLSVPGTAPGTKGGAVEIATTGNVSLASTARINASGRTGGGTVAIGTTLARARGGPGTTSSITAKNVTIAAGATITADAKHKGAGGRVVALATDATQMSGSISARGGTLSGNGGFVEVSGGTLALTGHVDVSAPNGTIGTILLDPDTLEIINAALGGGDQDTNLGATGTLLAGGPNTTNNQISNGEIDFLLGSIVLQAKNTLTIDAGTPITLQPNASLSLSTLNGNILVGAGSPIVASGTGSIIMQAGTAGSGATLTLNSDLTTGAAGSIALQSDAGIALNTVTMATGLLDVSTFSAGGVTQSGGAIAASTLQSSAGIAGGLSLAGTVNAIANLGSIAISGGALQLNDAAALTIAGPVKTGTDASIGGAPTISVTGSIGAVGTLALNAGAGGIAFAGGAQGSGATVDISTTGTVSEAASGVISAGTLQSSAGIIGKVSLLGTGNTIATLGGLAVSGASSSFALIDASALGVTGTVSVAGAAQLSLQDTATGGIAIPSGALRADPSAGMVSLRTDAFSIAGSISAAVIELAPNTSGRNVTLGSASGLSLPSTSGLTASLLRVGSVTAPAGTRSTTAGAISIGGTFATTGTLELDASGAVTQTAPLLGGSLLTGTAGGFTLLNAANAIGAIALTSTSGNIQLVDASAVTLGATAAKANLYASAPGEILAGAMTAKGTLGLQTDSFTFSSGSLKAATIEIAPRTAGAAMTLGAAGSLSLPGLGFVTATTVRLGAITPPGKSLTTTAGTIVVGGAFGNSGTIELDSLGGIGETSGALHAATLIGNAAGNVSLSNANTIATLGAFTAGGTFALNDTSSLSIAGLVNAGVVDLSAPAISEASGGTINAGVMQSSFGVPGNVGLDNANSITTLAAFAAGGSLTLHDATSLSVSGSVSAATLALNAPGIAFAGGAVVSGSVIDLTSNAGITEPASATISAATVQSSGGAFGNVSLAGSANAIATLGAFVVSGGNLLLTDATNLAISGSGLAAGNITIATLGSLNVTAGMSAPGTIALAANGVTIGSGGSASGAALIDVNGSAGGIALTGNGNISSAASGTVDLSTTGSIAEAPTATLSAALLQSSLGVTGTVSLPHAAIGTVGSFDVTGSFSLNDSATLSMLGPLTATNISLTAPSINIGGIVSDGGSGTTSLIATKGSIGETGTLIAGTLSGSAASNAILAGANRVGTLASFTAASFTLNDTTPLIVAGTLSAPAIALTATSIALPGTVSDGGAGTTSLIATTGTINQTGTLIAGTLSGGSPGDASFASANVATLGSFTATNFTLHDASAVAIAGPISAASVSLAAPSISGTGVISTPLFDATATGTISLTGANKISTLGSVTATSLNLHDTASLTLGKVTATTVDLIVAGTIGETGTLSATTLSGSATGLADFGGSNAVTNLGSFSVSSGSLILVDSSKLNVTAPVTASGSIYLASSKALGVAIASGGTLSSPLTSIQADAFSNSGAVSATTFELAPFHSSSPMTIPPTAGITTATARFGAVTVPGSGLATTAGSIIIGASFGAPTMAIELDSLGGITETTGALTAATLAGHATGGATLGNANSIATLSGFTAGGTFLLNDASALSIAGTLNAPLADLSATSITETKGGTIVAATLQSSGGVTGNVALGNTNTIGTVGSFTAGGTFALNDASSLTINGPLHAAIVDLTAAGLTEPAAAVISTATLQSSGGVAGDVSLAGSANAIGTLGGFIVTGGSFTMTDAASLTIAGSGVAADGIAITTPGSLNVAAGMFAPGTIALAANGVAVGSGGSMFGAAVIDVNGGSGGIALTGSGNIGSSGSGTVDLSTTGGITEAPTATLLAGLLQSSLGVTGDVSLPHTAIGAIGNFIVSAGSFALTDSAALSVLGALTATKSVALSAPSIDIPGLVSDGGSGTTSLIATTGSIGETGSLIAGTLSGSAATGASLIGTNQIGTLGNFTAASFALDDTTPLLVSGTVSAPSIALAAASIDIPGKVTDGGSGTTSLVATTGTIAETGTLIAGTLSGSAAAAATFASANIGTIAGFTAATSFNLLDGSSLTVNGLSAAVVILAAPSINIPGALTGTTSIDLVATSGGIGGGGSVATPLLTGSAVGSVGLTGPNAIASIGNFTASGFILTNNTDLAVNGTLAGGPSITIVDNGVFTGNGSITANAISITASDIELPGFVSDGGAGTVNLVSAAQIGASGTLIAGTLTGSAASVASLNGASPGANRIATLGDFAAPNFSLSDGRDLAVSGTLAIATGGITDVGTLTLSGTMTGNSTGLTATSLVVSGVVISPGVYSLIATGGSIVETGSITTSAFYFSAPGSVDLSGASPTANQIGSIGGGVGITANGFTLRNGVDLVIDASINGGPNISISDAGSISEISAGALIATSLTGAAAGPVSLTGPNQIITLADFTAPSFVLNNIIALPVAGILSAGASAQLTASGPITEPGTIIAGSLSGSAAGPATFTGTNQIAALGPFSATDLTLIDTQSLAVTGNVNANNVALTIAGNLTGTAALATNTLTGTASGNVSLTGGNTIATLNAFSAGGSLVLNNASNLTIASTLTAPKIVITDAAQLTLGDGATITTGGSAKPAPNVTFLPNASSTPQGAFLSAASFLQLGSSSVTGISSANIVRIDTSGAGKLAFDPSAGLNAPDTWLVVGVGQGQISGNVNVAALDITYGSVSGGSSLTGTVGGISGVTAAGAVGIQPAANPNYRFNSCVIHSVNCVLLPTASIPTANPLNVLDIGALSNAQDQEDFLLPVVSDQDY